MFLLSCGAETLTIWPSFYSGEVCHSDHIWLSRKRFNSFTRPTYNRLSLKWAPALLLTGRKAGNTMTFEMGKVCPRVSRRMEALRRAGMLQVPWEETNGQFILLQLDETPIYTRTVALNSFQRSFSAVASQRPAWGNIEWRNEQWRGGKCSELTEESIPSCCGMCETITFGLSRWPIFVQQWLRGT